MSRNQSGKITPLFKALSVGTAMAVAGSLLPSAASAQPFSNSDHSYMGGYNFNAISSPLAPIVPADTPVINIPTSPLASGLLSSSPRPYRTGRWYDHLTAEQSYALAERTIGIPADLLARIAYNESNGNPDAVNSMSGACGLGQLMPNTTLPEMAYKYSDTFGFNFASNIERYDSRMWRGEMLQGYRAVNGFQNDLLAECHHEWVNVAFFSMNIIEKARRVEAAFAARGVEIENYNQADGYILHWLGARDDLILALRQNPDSLARNFVNGVTIEQNRPMFYNGRQPRTVRQVYDFIGKNGNGPDQYTLIPRFWDIDPLTIAQRVDMAFAEPTQTASLSPAQS